MYQFRSKDKTSTKNSVINFLQLAKFLLTIVALASAVGSILSAWIFYVEERPYSRIESSIYAAVHRIPWSLGIGWLIIGDAIAGLGKISSFSLIS